MLDHVGLTVLDVARSRAFFAAALAPLGYAPVMDVTTEETGGYEGTGFGADGKPSFWIGNGPRAGGPIHVAFAAKSRADVDRFYDAERAAGGRAHGPPAFASTTTRLTTARSCSISTATMSRRSATCRADQALSGNRISSGTCGAYARQRPIERA